MLRQDYEAEHTLTQQGSQALREAIADLAATKAARAAAAETTELPRPTDAEPGDDTASVSTVRARAK
jgi:hypothetical protein